MFQSLQQIAPAEWQGALTVLSTPLAWLPDFHSSIVNLAWFGDSTLEIVLKRTFLLLPVLLGLVGLWCTMLSLYTLPFRSHRAAFMTTLATSWWEVGRSIWFFWAGFLRSALLALGWFWASFRLGIRMVLTGIKGAFRSPLVFLDWTSRTYFKPGVPWVAFLALMLWGAVEATIFMYTLTPTMTEVLAGITGYEPNAFLMGPILWIFLFLLILGSFACIQVFADAVASRRWGEIVQMAFVEAFVMFFEVIFLYRELVDAVTPWIAQTTNEAVQMGLVSTLALASFGWIGVRGMTWFLFGRFGTPAVLAILSRETVTVGDAVPLPAFEATPELWRGPINALKGEIAWFRKEGRHAFEIVTLPVLQLLATAINFFVVIITARPMFSLPFTSIDQVMAMTPKWTRAHHADANVALEPRPAAQGGAS